MIEIQKFVLKRIDAFQELKTKFMMKVEDEETDCNESGGLSAFTFLNFMLAAVSLGANVVDNINSNQNNNNDNSNNDNSNNINIGSNNNNANNMNTVGILPGGRKRRDSDECQRFANKSSFLNSVIGGLVAWHHLKMTLQTDTTKVVLLSDEAKRIKDLSRPALGLSGFAIVSATLDAIHDR